MIRSPRRLVLRLTLGCALGAALLVPAGAGAQLSQEAYLKASNTGAGDAFGGVIAMSGDTMVVGASSEDSNATGVNGTQNNNSAADSGAAYVYVRTGATWTQQAYLKASNTDAGDGFGTSVAISGNTIVVGARFEDSNATGINGNQADNSATQSGAAYVFTRTGSTWTQQAYLKASNTNTGDAFGDAAAISGDTIVVGARGEASNATGVNSDQTDNTMANSGAAYVFTRTGSAWTQQAYLKASNTGLADAFGSAVTISGDTTVVGARLEDSNATGINGDQSNNSLADSGAAYVFTRTGSTWTQQAYLKESNTGFGDFFAYSLAIDGDTLVVGAQSEDSGSPGVNGDQSDNGAVESGAAYVFTRTGSTWTQQAYVKASNPEFEDHFGSRVALLGNDLVVGARHEDSSVTGIDGNQADNGATDSGAAYVFTRSGGTWAQEHYLKAPNTGANDEFGTGVAISAEAVVVGAPFEDSNSTGVGGNQTNNDAADSGAAYAFGPPPPAPAFTVTPTSRAFGNQGTGTSSASQTFTVTNTGNANLTITLAGLTGTHEDQFSKSADTCSGATVAPAATCTVQVRFSPTTTGAKSATLRFVHDAAGSPSNVALTGTGTTPNVTGPGFSVTPTSKAYGNQDTGTDSAFQTFTVTNTGTAGLVIALAAVIGTDRNQFDEGTDSCTGATIAPAATCTVQVGFSPTTTGAKTATLRFAHNATGSPSNVALTGNATTGNPPPDTTVKCRGKDATIVGTRGADVLRGTPGRDIITGLGGNDRIKGKAGNDLICGGKGKDLLKGGKGKDRLYGGRGNDTLNGGPGKDLTDPRPLAIRPIGW